MEIIALVFVLAVLATVVFVALSFEKEIFHVTGSAVDIRLIGVRPDASDDIYDVEGKKIGTRFYDGDNLNAWGSNNLRRDFIFELPFGAGIQPVNYQVQLENQKWFVISGNFPHTELTNRHIYSISTTFSETSWHSSMFFGSARPVEFVDVTLSFYSPHRGQPAVQFKGPFANGVTNQAQWQSELTFTGVDTANGTTNARFHFSTSLASLSPSSLIFRDRNGGEHIASLKATSSNGRSLTWDGNVPKLPLNKIASVEIHVPQEKTFHHIRVRYHDHKKRAYPEANDKLATVLGTNVFPSTQIATFSFTNATQALAVIDLVRGAPSVENAWNSIRDARPPVDFSKLPVPEQDRIEVAARTWASADDPNVRRCGEELQRAVAEGGVTNKQRAK